MEILNTGSDERPTGSNNDQEFWPILEPI